MTMNGQLPKTSKYIQKWVKHKGNTIEYDQTYKEIKKKYIGYKTYFTHDNGNRPYLVYIKDNELNIYNKPDIKDSLDINKQKDIKYLYTNFVKKFTAKKIFIGKSPKIKMTEYSGGYGKYFDGNTILLYLENNNYIIISDDIEEFHINDEIEEYYSLVGNNDVPYPMAIGKKNIYFFRYPEGYLSKSEFPMTKSKDNLQNIFDKGIELNPFLIKYNNKNKNYKITLEEFKLIQQKSLSNISLDTIKKLAKMYSVTASGTKDDLMNRIKKLRGVIICKIE